MSDSDSNGAHADSPGESAKSLGYSEDEIRSVPQGVVCRGCGNPTVSADLQEGEIVLDLGSGAGLDAFLAAKGWSDRQGHRHRCFSRNRGDGHPACCRR